MKLTPTNSNWAVPQSAPRDVNAPIIESNAEARRLQTMGQVGQNAAKMIATTAMDIYGGVVQGAVQEGSVQLSEASTQWEGTP